MTRKLSAAGLLGCLLACTSAHVHPTKPSDIGLARPAIHEPKTPSTRKSERIPPSVPSHTIAKVPDHTVGPLLARSGSGQMAAYLGPLDNGQRRIVGIPLNPDGSPRDARLIAPAGTDATMLVFRPLGSGEGGYLAAWTQLTERGEALLVAGVAADATPTEAPVEIAHTSDDVVWVETVATSRGAVTVWAEETRAGDANILAVAVDGSGKPKGVPSRVARGVVGWQAVATPMGVGLGLVSSPAGRTGKGSAAAPRPSTLSWLKLDAEGRPVGPATIVASASASMADMDVTRAGRGFVFAWTDRTSLDANVLCAAVDGEGKLHAPKPLTEQTGGASLVAMAGDEHGGAIAWEETTKRSRATRRVHFSRIDADTTTLRPSDTVLELEVGGAPEFVATSGGFALLGRARACAEPASTLDPPCSEAPSMPSWVRFDKNLAAVEDQPIRLEEDHVPAVLAWGLSCAADHCLALAASAEPRVRVSAVDLVTREARFRAPTVPPSPPEAPQLEAMATLVKGPPFAEVAAVRVADVEIFATSTSTLEEPVKGGLAHGATIAVRAAANGGDVLGAPAILSSHAVSVGGLAIAAGGSPEDGAAVAWIARDDGDEEVHVATVNARGQRRKDVRLTMVKGDASDVAIAWAGGGWIVGWVDVRDGNGEVYAAKVGLGLERLSADERVTNAPGDASDVAVIARPGGVWIAWADPRESPHDGFADIFVAGLRGKDARTEIPEARVLATAAHSRSPVLAPGEGGGLAIAWIEEAPMDADNTNSGSFGAMVGSLGPDGHLLGEALRTHGAGQGYPTSVAIERNGSALRTVLARSARDELVIDAFELPAGGSARPFPVFSLDGPPSLDVSMTLDAGSLFYIDDADDGGRVRRAKLAFHR